jgi:KDO2-lipid IV(A) lauroyltransferase
VGVLLLFRHSIFLELSARLISEKFAIYGMERPNNNEVIQKIMNRGRLRAMKGLTSNSNVSQLIDWLKDGKTVLYGPDQDYKNKRSVVSEFFKQKCLTTTVPYTLKNITKCKLIYLDFYKTPDGYEFIFKDVSNIADSKQNFADNINSIIERSVIKAPEHYFWHHRRFKSQTPEIYD